MRVIHFYRGEQTRCIRPETKTCVFLFKGAIRTTQLGCAVTYAARLVEAGWRIQLVEDDDC